MNICGITGFQLTRPVRVATNQRGLPFYMTQEDLKHDMGVEMWGRSFPIILNTIPQGVIELSISA